MLKELFKAPEKDPNAKRFEVVKEEDLGFRKIYVIRDVETGVCYMTGTDDTCPFTPLLQVDGTPYLQLK